MLHSITLSHFYPNKYETAVVGPIRTQVLIENTNEQVPCELTICLEGRCSATGCLDLKEGRRECQVEFQFPLLFKNRLEKVFKKENFVAKAVVLPGPSETTILKLFSDKLVKDAEVYVSYLNVDSNTTALSINNEADCALENSELMQPFLLFLLRCSIPNQAPQESFLQPIYSMIQKSDAPHASRNAIAILSRIGYSFFRENLEGINISGARLEGTLLYGAKLDKSKMTGAYIKDACFHQASLINANMDGIDTGRKPSLIHDSEISNWSISPNERHVAVCTKDGKVYVWNVKNFTLHKKTPLLTSILRPLALKYRYSFEQPSIIFVKFINENQLILITKSGIIVLWSLTLSQIIDHKPSIIYTQKESSFFYVFKILKICLKNIFCTNKPNSNGIIPLVLSYAIEVRHSRHLRIPLEKIKFACEIWGVTDNAIIPIKKESYLETGFQAGLPYRVSIDFKSQTSVFTSTQDSLICLSPSGWLAYLMTENSESSLTLIQTPHIDRFVKFSLPHLTHWCNFSHDNSWLIGVTLINQENCVVKWSTTELYSIQPAAAPTMEMPRPETLFTTQGVIERCDLVPNSDNCIYSSGSIIYVRNLSNHGIIYQADITELQDFKIVFKENLLLTNVTNSYVLEARDVCASVNASVQTTHTNLRVGCFTPNSQKLIMLPRNLSLLQWIIQTDDINRTSQYLFSSNLSNLKNYLKLKQTDKKNFKELRFFSPSFKYMALIDPDVNQICIWNIAEDKEHYIFKNISLYTACTVSYPLNKVFQSLYEILKDLQLAEHNLKVALSDELSLAITFQNGRVAIYDLYDPNKIKIICILDAKSKITNIHLSKCIKSANTIFISLKNIIFQHNYFKKKPLMLFRNYPFEIIAFDVSFDNQFLVSSDTESIRLWDIESGNEIDKQDTPFPLSDLQFAFNDRFIASFSKEEGVTYLWEVQESKLRLILLYPKQLGCRGADFRGVVLSELNELLFDQLQAKDEQLDLDGSRIFKNMEPSIFRAPPPLSKKSNRSLAQLFKVDN